MAQDEAFRTETFPSGIASVGLAAVTRQVRSDEPPPLPPNAEFAVIGKPVPRPNGRAKVTGAMDYTADIILPSMLHARILRSPLPHAAVRAVDLSGTAGHPGVRAILLVARPDDPARATVRYVGAPVSAIAAVSMAAADEALHLIRVDYEPLPFVVDMGKARGPDAPPVHDAVSAPAGHPFHRRVPAAGAALSSSRPQQCLVRPERRAAQQAARRSA